MVSFKRLHFIFYRVIINQGISPISNSIHLEILINIKKRMIILHTDIIAAVTIFQTLFNI